MAETQRNLPTIASRDDWFAARKKLLSTEKELTYAKDRVNTQRRELPMVLVEKQYTFDGPNGQTSLLDMFEGREQLVIQHVMWALEWEHLCTSCATGCDSIPRLRQLNARNTTFAAVSRAPYHTLSAFSKRMEWEFPWYSSNGTSFNDDFFAILKMRANGEERHQEEIPGLSAFLRVDDQVYHTYSTTGRGVELIFGEYPVLDITALGRQEDWEQPRGRAKPLGLQAGGPAVRLPDQL